MEPMVSCSGWVVCDRLYAFRKDFRIGDIVVIHYVGKTYLLKRILALPRDTVEFKNGIFRRNGIPVEEPYVRFRAQWNLAPRIVPLGKIYVAGDNRGMPMCEHIFGAIDISRIAGRYWR